MPSSPPSNCPKCGSSRIERFEIFGCVVDSSEPDWQCLSCECLFNFPPLLLATEEPQNCAICGASLEAHVHYPGSICWYCDGRAGTGPETVALPSAWTGDLMTNPVYVDGVKCWRRYRMGGQLTIVATTEMDRVYREQPEVLGYAKGTKFGEGK